MLKTLTTGIIGATIAIGLTGCGDTELTDAEIDKLAVCENSAKGVKRFNKSISSLVLGGRLKGIKSSVTKNGDELKLILSPDSESVEFLFQKIDEGELSKYDISCYEIQSIKGNNNTVTKKDKTLNGFTIMPFFGILLPSEQESRENKVKQELEDKERKEAQAQRQREYDEKKTEQKRQKLAKQQIKIDEAQNKFNKAQSENEKLNKVLSIQKEFEKTSGILRKINDNPSKIEIWNSDEAKNVKLTNKILNDYLNLFEVTKTINESIVRKRKSDISTIKDYLKLDINKRTASQIRNLFNIYGRFNYTFNEYTRYITSPKQAKTELERAKEYYNKIEKRGY
jgi:hypothetical protein